MHAPAELRITKWPFFVGDVLLLALAVFFCFHTGLAVGGWEMFLSALWVAGGALLAVALIVLIYRTTP